jgi:hypothetical protein
MSENTGTAKQVDLTGKVVGEIKLPTLDVSQYIGKKVRIDGVKEYEGSFGYYIRIESSPVDVRKDMPNESGEALILKASRVFGLQTDAKKQLGWGKDTKLGLFLAKMGVKHYNELIGKTVTVQLQAAKDGKEYLTF